MKVLVALDGSEIGEAALKAIAPWAEAANAVVYLLTVIHPRQIHETFSTEGILHSFTPEGTPNGKLTGVKEPFARPAEDRSQALARARAAAEDYLAHMAALCLPAGAGGLHVEWSESTAAAIAEFAEAFEVDFIAMGTHGRRGLSHALLGSVAEEVVRRASVPVLMVRQGMRVGGREAAQAVA
jgi:nucleotide-binding universal stress UspA family protein